MTCRRQAASQMGVSLLELLVALFIFALAAAGLLKVVGEQGRHAAQLEARYFAEVAAHNYLVERQLLPTWPDLGERAQPVTLAGRDYLIREQVEATDTEAVRRITVTVHRQEGSGPALSQLQAFMGPTP